MPNCGNGTMSKLLVEKSMGSCCLRSFTFKHLMKLHLIGRPRGFKKEQDVEQRRVDSWNLLAPLCLPLTVSNHDDLL